MTDDSKKFLRDLILVASLWTCSLWMPLEWIIFRGLPYSTLFKIVAIVATLQMVGLPLTHWLGKRNGYLIQGFLGGFVSSTVTFIQLTQDGEMKGVPASAIVRALILATVAMLLEGVAILSSFDNKDVWVASRPLLVQLAALILYLIATWSIHEKSSPSPPGSLPPIPRLRWIKVLWLALFIVALIYVMRLIGEKLDLPFYWGSFFLSLFESHGVLAAAATQFAGKNDPAMAKMVFTILAGATISKIFFTLRVKEEAVRRPLLGVLALSLFAAAIATFSPR